MSHRRRRPMRCATPIGAPLAATIPTPAPSDRRTPWPRSTRPGGHCAIRTGDATTTGHWHRRRQLPQSPSPTEVDDDEPVVRRPSYNPLARYQDPPRFPWRLMAVLAGARHRRGDARRRAAHAGQTRPAGQPPDTRLVRHRPDRTATPRRSTAPRRTTVWWSPSSGSMRGARPASNRTGIVRASASPASNTPDPRRSGHIVGPWHRGSTSTSCTPSSNTGRRAATTSRSRSPTCRRCLATPACRSASTWCAAAPSSTRW